MRFNSPFFLFVTIALAGAVYAQPFTPPPHASAGDTVLRARVDARRDRLWVLEIGRVHVVDRATNRRIRTVALPNWMYSVHEDLCLPDLALDERGAAYVSDNIQTRLWRIDPVDFSIDERSVKLDRFAHLDSGFSALAIGEGGVMFAAMAAPGLLWRIDTGTFRAQNVPLASRIFGVCALEAARGARSRDFTLHALQVRDRYTVSRVRLARGRDTAAVTPVSTASTDATYVFNSLKGVAMQNLAQTESFDKAGVGGLPPGWKAGVTGEGAPKWAVTADQGAPSAPNTLVQSGKGTFPWCVKDGVSLADGYVEVKFKPMSGREDQAGGVVWRWKDGNNYYVARANALENNVSLYYTANGRRNTIKYVDAPVAGNAWHTLRVDFTGTAIKVAVDGKTYIEVKDTHIAGAGAVGVWTKADSVTAFDDFSWGVAKSR